jgi:hypothetical protein
MGGGQEKRGNQVGFHCPPARQSRIPEKNASIDRLEASFGGRSDSSPPLRGGSQGPSARHGVADYFPVVG